MSIVQSQTRFQVDIVRPNQEFTRYDPSNEILRDIRKRRDGAGVYELKKEIRTGKTDVVYGESDRTAFEDRVVSGIEEWVLNANISVDEGDGWL